MTGKQVVLTDEGLKKLEEEYEYLKTVRRKEISEKIRIALSFGDLSENSEYDEAKNEQAFVESRILQIEGLLKNVRILDEDELSTDFITIGSKVRLLDVGENEEIVYQIVGSTEADPLGGRISDESPVGKALLHKRAGDQIEVEVPAGVFHYKVLEILK